MPRANTSIHRLFVKRFLVVWILVSLGLGAATYFLEWETTDSFVVALAQEETSRHLSGLLSAINSKKASDRAIIQTHLHLFLDEGHFLIVEYYDRQGRKIAEAMNKGAEDFEKWLDRLPHETYLNGQTKYRRLQFKEHTYMQVFLPLYDEDGSLNGHFEGIYRIPGETMLRLERQPVITTLVVLVAVLLAMGIVYPVTLRLGRDLAARSASLAQANIGMLESLGAAISKRDSDTSEHNYRVTLYAVRLAEKSGRAAEEIQALIKGAFLHDIGKIGISDTILLKPGKLNDDEFAAMQTHVVHGVDIIDAYAWLNDALDVVHGHHEKVDGSGYPEGLAGEAIPINARIFAIADVFDALLSERPYKKAFPLEQTIAILVQGKGSHFDAALLDTFLTIAPDLAATVGASDPATLKTLLHQTLATYFEM